MYTYVDHDFVLSLPHIRMPKKVKIYVAESGNTLNTTKQFLKHLPKRKVKIVEDAGACDAILGFCPVISRVGTDIEAALKDFEGKNAWWE